MEGALIPQDCGTAHCLGVLLLWAYAKDAAGGNPKKENNLKSPKLDTYV